jgi:DNA invertase Pin-like site-specific DNA recombinase
MLTSELIKPHHLRRLAIVYVRQSSPHQVLTNTESRRLQLALRQRAEQLGWASENVRVLESDTAQSASTLAGRAGFQELVTLVSTDQVGIIFAYDAQRLARNCTDWYPLLDVCGFRQCLIADGDGVYDPADPNGRLLLGLKGQIAEWELHTLQRRCLDALEAKAQRGELNQILPAGLERDAAGVVRKAAHQEVQERLALVFDTFWKQKSIAKTVRDLRQRGLSIPRKDRFGQLVWRSPTVSSIGSILTNPAYAGAYVRGRTQPYRNAQGKMRQRRLPMDRWRICLHDQYPPYVSWERFQAIYAMIQDNYQQYDRNRTRGVPRPGKALLHGLVCCGECGHKMVVQYKGGTRYLCNYLRGQHQTPVCQHLPGDAIDAWVVQQFFSALSAAELDLFTSSQQQASQEQARVARAWEQQLQRLRYQAQLAERQFLAADPDNRLVTSELERRWEEALRAHHEAEAAWQREQSQRVAAAPLPAELRELLESAGQRLPELWARKDFLSQTQRKAMLRSLIDKVVAHRVASDAVQVRIVWRGGQTTEATLPVPVSSWRELSLADAMERTIVKLARKGTSDEEIAQALTRHGYRSPMRMEVLPSTVRHIRLKHRILRKACQSHPRRVPGCLTVSQLAARLGVSPHWIYDRIHNGTIRVTKDAERNTFLFPDKPKTLKRFQQLRDGRVQELDF